MKMLLYGLVTGILFGFLPARRAAFPPGANHPVGRFDQFLITLNRDLTAAAFNQAQQHAQRAGGIRQAMPVVGSSSR